MKTKKLDTPILEHEILKTIYTKTSLNLVGHTTHYGTIPIWKRNYSNSNLHYGLLLDILNNPDKYKNEISALQNKSPLIDNIAISKYTMEDLSKALEVLLYNGQVEEKGQNDKQRIIQLTPKGAVDYINSFYQKERDDIRLKREQIISVIKTNKYSRTNVIIAIVLGFLSAMFSGTSLYKTLVSQKKLELEQQEIHTKLERLESIINNQNSIQHQLSNKVSDNKAKYDSNTLKLMPTK